MSKKGGKNFGYGEALWLREGKDLQDHLPDWGLGEENKRESRKKKNSEKSLRFTRSI